MLVYMDLCCFNRPFDNQSNYRVYLETEAKLFIQRQIKDGKISLAWSYMLDFENSANPDIDSRNSIQLWNSIAACRIIESPSLLQNAAKYRNLGIGIKDAIHVACSVESRAAFFLTVDKGLLKKRRQITEIDILNPIDFFEMEEIDEI
jgi:hypothetical protein